MSVPHLSTQPAPLFVIDGQVGELLLALDRIDALRLSADVALIQRDEDHGSGGVEAAQGLLDLLGVEIKTLRTLVGQIDTAVNVAVQAGRSEH